MRFIALSVAFVLAGCATPESRVEKMIARYGPDCEKLGYQERTDGWRTCVLALEQQRINRAGNAAMIYNATRPR